MVNEKLANIKSEIKTEKILYTLPSPQNIFYDSKNKIDVFDWINNFILDVLEIYKFIF